MRTLAVDALRLAGRRTAMGRYIEHLAWHWSRMRTPFDRIVLMSRDEVGLAAPGAATEVQIRRFAARWPRLLWEQLALPREAGVLSVLFCPAYVCPLLHGGPVVVANHGIYESLPGEFSAWQRLRTIPLFRASARRADSLIANSRATKDDLVARFGLSPSKVIVIPPAAHERFFESQPPEAVDRAVRSALGSRAPYVLFVGKLSRRRNVPALIEAFARARRQAGLPHQLLIVGPDETKTGVARIAGRHGVAACVKHLPHLEQHQLAPLYAGADLFALPTVGEGLSWTILEAMASGTPVLTADHPALVELGEEVVHHISSPAVDDLVRALVALLKDRSLRERYREHARERAACFSWRASAEATLRVLDEVARGSDRSAG